MVDLVVSIINHSNPQMLWDCLRSIYVGTSSIEIEIWVIDNATDQRLISDIQAEFPEVKWLFNQSRLGFSSNHNQVLGRAQGRYFCILNDDVIVHPNALDTLVDYLDKHATAGMAGPRTLNRDGSIQNSTFRAKSLTRELVDILQLPGGLNRLKLGGIDPAQNGASPTKVDWLLGACIVTRKETIEAAGLLDDVMSPVANCEELEWCDRVRLAGWSVDFVPFASITHFGGQSLQNNLPGADRFRVEMHRVTLAYFRKQHGLLASLMLRLIYLGTLPWNTVMLLQSVLRGRTGKPQGLATWSTLVQVAITALRPLPQPYCRRDWPNTSDSSQPLGKQVKPTVHLQVGL